MASRSDREKSKMQEKYQIVLNQMLREEDNRYCVDCDAKSPRWASWNIGVFICIRCAGFHRNLGVHISKVKSVNLDSWTGGQIASMQAMGNSRARAVYEANLPDGFRRPQADTALEAFIRAKYEQRKWIAKEWIPPEMTMIEAESNQWQNDNQPEVVEQSAKKESVVKPLPMPIPAPVSTPVSNGTVFTEDLLNLNEPSVPSANDQSKQSVVLDPLHELFFASTPSSQETNTATVASSNHSSSSNHGSMTTEQILALFNTPSPQPSIPQSPTFPSAMYAALPPKSMSFSHHLSQHQLNPSIMPFTNKQTNTSATSFIPSMSTFGPSNTFWQ